MLIFGCRSKAFNSLLSIDRQTERKNGTDDEGFFKKNVKFTRGKRRGI
jgi:hypothetical protein